jgi:hypothetical protein
VRKSTTIGFLVILAFGALITFIRLNEPRYNGRTLTGWLQEYSDASMDETQRLAEARSAVLAIGAPRSAVLNLARDAFSSERVPRSRQEIRAFLVSYGSMGDVPRRRNESVKLWLKNQC